MFAVIRGDSLGEGEGTSYGFLLLLVYILRLARLTPESPWSADSECK